MAVKLSPIGNDAPFVDSSGNPLSGGLIYTYVAGSSTPANTYTTSAGNVANANPVVLDSAGYPSVSNAVVEIWLTSGTSYKFVLKNAGGTTLWTRDNISGINDTSVTIDQWVSGPAPTYVSATSFTLVGDQTTDFHPGRMLKSTNTSGTVYSVITASVFGAVTTVTVANFSGATLDSGLSAVSYSLITAVNPSINSDMVDRKATAVASAATTAIWTTNGNFVHVTGSTGPITSFGTAPYAGIERTIIWDSTPTVTHNATTLQIPGGANVTVAAGDRWTVRADTTANAIVTQITKADGTSVVSGFLESGDLASNITIVATRGGSAETISLKTKAGTDPTAADPIKIAFRDATIGTGGFTTLTISGATAITIPSTATMGMTNAVSARLWLVGFNDATTFRLGIVNRSSSSGCPALCDDLLQSSTLTPAGAGGVIYTTGGAVSAKAMRVLGYLDYTLAAVGTWGTAPTKIQIFGQNVQSPDAFISADQTITAAGTLTLAHGLGVVPTEGWLQLRCTTNDNNFTAGMILDYAGTLDVGGSLDRGCARVFNATNIVVRYGANATTFGAIDNTSGANVALTNANWRAIFYARA